MQKILNFQKKVASIKKSETNPFFNSKYFDINGIIEVIKPILNEEGLIVVQPLAHRNGQPALETFVIDAETGETLLSSITPLPDISDPQKMGSAITYMRRYSLQSLLLLEAEDDDANIASQTQQASQRPAKPFLQNFHGGKSVPTDAQREEMKTININEL